MDDNAIAFTNLTSHKVRFRFPQMPFVLMSAPATFQRAIDIILCRVKWTFAMVYWDDVIIFSGCIREHFTHARAVIRLLQPVRATLRLTKGFFSTTIG